MTFELLPALIAGLAATLVVPAMMTMSASMGMTRMPPMPLVNADDAGDAPARVQRSR